MRRFVAPAVLLGAAVVLGVLAWWTSGLVLYVCAAFVGAIAAGWAVASARAGRRRALTATLVAVLVATVAVATPRWLAARTESSAAWSAELSADDDVWLGVVGDRVFVVTLREGGPAELVVRDLDTGRTRWRRTIPGGWGTETDRVEVRATADGEVVVRLPEADGDHATRVLRVAPTGPVRWQREVDGTIQAVTERTIVTLSCTADQSGDVPHCRYRGVDRAGTTVWSRTTHGTTDRTWSIRADERPRTPEPTAVAVVTGAEGRRVVRLLDPDTGRTRNSVRLSPDDRRPDVWRLGDSAWVVTRKGTERDCRWRVIGPGGSRQLDPGDRCDEVSGAHLVGRQTLLVLGTDGQGWRVDLAGQRVVRAPKSQVESHLSDEPDTTTPRLRVTPIEHGNPFHRRGGGDTSPHRVTLLAADGRDLASVICERRPTDQVVGDTWGLIRCDDRLLMLSRSDG